MKSFEKRIGDVFSMLITDDELNPKGGVAFCQCVKYSEAKNEFDITRVLPGIYEDVDSKTIGEIIRKKELFFEHTPLAYAIRKRQFAKLIKYVGNYPIPKGSECPRYFRDTPLMPGAKGWVIIDNKTDGREYVKELTPEIQALSPWGSYSYPDIIERIEKNWTPMEWTEGMPYPKD